MGDLSVSWPEFVLVQMENSEGGKSKVKLRKLVLANFPDVQKKNKTTSDA